MNEKYLHLGNTSNLATHLNSSHPNLKGGIRPMDMFLRKNEEKKVPLPESEKKKVDKAVEDFIIGTLSAISIVDRDPFRNLCTTLNAR